MQCRDILPSPPTHFCHFRRASVPWLYSPQGTCRSAEETVALEGRDRVVAGALAQQEVDVLSPVPRHVGECTPALPCGLSTCYTLAPRMPMVLGLRLADQLCGHRVRLEGHCSFSPLSEPGLP